MSENKYIIDKDSLTGIADAVRDKLGVGEATTDPQTGDIVYPKDKGYYLNLIAKIYGFGWSRTGYSGNFIQNHTPLINDENWNEAVGEPWYSVEITLVNVQGRLYNMDVSYTGGNQNFTDVRSSTYTVSAPNGSTYFNLYFGNEFNPNISYASSSLGSLTAIFKDAEGKPIRPKQSSYHYLWKTQQRVRDFKTGEVEIPIPLTIDDIRNKIKDYWSIPDGSLDISANGTYDVTTKASAIVNVPNPSTGSLTINTNGTYDVTEKASAIVSVSPSLQTKTTTISQNGSQIITPDSNYDGLSSVNLTISVPNPSTGSLEITKNGTYDVTNKAEAVVNVPNPSTGSLEITENGTYDVTDKASAVVNVPIGGGGGGTAEQWGATKFKAGKGPYTLTYLDTFEKFSTHIRAVQITNKLGAVLFKTDGTLCSYKDLNMAAPKVGYNAIPNSISNQDVIDAYNDDRIFAINTYDNDHKCYMGFKDNKIFFGYNNGNLGDNVGDVVLYYV